MIYVLTSNGNTTISKYPYTLRDLVSDNPNTSFPDNISCRPSVLAEFNVYTVATVAKPTTTVAQIAEEGTPEKVSDTWTQVWTVRAATAPEQAAASVALATYITAQTQVRLDAFARTRNYDDIKSLAGYDGDSDPQFAAEGAYGKLVRSQTWRTLYNLMEQVQLGNVAPPTSFSEVESLLPPLVWPV